MPNKSPDDSYTASLPSRRASEIRDRWSSGYQFLIFALSCTISDYSMAQFIFVKENEQSGHLVQYLLGYVIVALPMYYMQVFIGQYTQIGIVSMKYICPIGHGLCYLYLANLIIACIVFSLNFVPYVVYQFITFRKEIPWLVCPGHHPKCWTNDERNHRCPANCLKTNDTLSSYGYHETKFWAYKQNIFILHRGMLPLAIGWIIVVCLVTYAVTKRRRLLKILLALSLIPLGVTVLGLIIENGISYFVAQLFHVNFRVFLDYHSWRNVILSSITFLSLGRGFHILNGSFLSATSQSGTLSVVGVLLAFIVSLLLSTLPHLSVGIIKATAKVNETYQLPFRYGRSYQIFCNVPQALGCMGFSHFFTVLYFFGSFILLVTNQICHLITIEKCLADLFPSLSRYRKYVYSITCLFCFLFSSFFLSTSRLVRILYYHTTQGLLNAISFNAMMSNLVVFWIYGVQNLCDDIHFLMGVHPNKFWRICWYFTPVFTALAFVANISTVMATGYWALAILISPFVFTCVYEMFKCIRARNIIGFFQKDENYGPPNEMDKIQRKFFNPRTEIRCRRQHDVCPHSCLNGSKVLQKFLQEEAERESKIQPNVNI